MALYSTGIIAFLSFESVEWQSTSFPREIIEKDC